MTSFHAAPGLRDGFWSDSNTEMSFLGRLTLMKVHVRTVSLMAANRRSSCDISGARGSTMLPDNSRKAVTLNLNINFETPLLIGYFIFGKT